MSHPEKLPAPSPIDVGEFPEFGHCTRPLRIAMRYLKIKGHEQEQAQKDKQNQTCSSFGGLSACREIEGLRPACSLHFGKKYEKCSQFKVRNGPENFGLQNKPDMHSMLSLILRFPPKRARNAVGLIKQLKR